MNSNSLAGEKAGMQSGGPKNSQIDLGEREAAGGKEEKLYFMGRLFFSDSYIVRQVHGWELFAVVVCGQCFFAKYSVKHHRNK